MVTSETNVTTENLTEDASSATKAPRKKSHKKRWIIIITILLLFIIVNIAMTKIIYDGIFKRYDKEAGVPTELTDMVNLRESVTFYSGEYELQGYLYTQEAYDGQVTDADGNYPAQADTPLVVIVPGFHSGTDNYLWQIQSLLDYDYDVFIFDATGSCESEGKSYIGFSQELFDLDAALDYIEETYNYNNICLIGHSRGAYAACGILESDHDISAVVSVSGINSAMDAIMGTAEKYVGPVAYGNYPFLWLYQATLFDGKTVSLQADDCISNSDVPTLIVQGDADDTAKMDNGSIYSHKDEITSDKVEYYICDVPGQNGHTDLLFDPDGTANDALMETIDTFFDAQMK